MEILKDLIDEFRDRVDDHGAKPLWSDKYLTRQANEAQREAARRARLFEDRTTAEIVNISVKAGKSVYVVDPRILLIQRVKITTEDVAMSKVDLRDLEEKVPGWEDPDNAQIPRCWTPWEDHKIRLVYEPDADASARLWTVRLPLADMSETVGPEVRLEHREGLVDWMCYRALNQRDKEEKFAPEVAAAHLAAFESEFGKRSSAIDETWIRRKHGFDDYEGLF